MVRSDIVSRLTKRMTGLPQQDVESSVKCIVRSLTRALASGRRVELRGFGSFLPNYRPPHKARNPRTGSTVIVANGYYRPRFRPGKELRKRVDISSPRS